VKSESCIEEDIIIKTLKIYFVCYIASFQDIMLF